ncbi:hypothetical protein [Pseudomonas sp. NFIX28]|uniref:hypothetical protein n=1 Tax=Pseudomonas sp. NFIX28 TaxID=1566235 RepID=UPI00089853AA|nr:hypothetical protein [Pseudomonas sp. NFIX28]SDY30343.1 hypothetical protein SAMN03159453_00159 [Pseudomonas sp. NFIX28]
MNIDKTKLKSLLWSVVASWKADDGDLQRHTTALDEILGDKTVEEVALLLIAENDRLEVEGDSSKTLLRDAIAREDQLKAENETLRTALGDLLSLYEADDGCRSLPEYIAGRAAMGKGEQP